MSRIKICGLGRREDIEAVNRAMPDYIGFVFAESRRRVEVKTAAMLKKHLDSRIKAVGVFVNENIENVEEVYRRGIIDLVQLHGNEEGAYIRRLKKDCGCEVIKAIGVGDRLSALPDEADYLLFDRLSQRHGGTGKAFDWNMLKDYRGMPYFLAGGILAGNVSDAVRKLGPYCIDVSSGVETDGVKDANKIEELVRLVRGID